jgi:uncharacterized low-complexity protein
MTLLAAAATAAPPRTNGKPLAQVKSVYLFPMSRGMDQYLASRLTRDGVVQVVADPLKADAILTDHLGASFEEKIKELYPEPKPVAKPPVKHERKAPEAKVEPKAEAKAEAKAAEAKPGDAKAADAKAGDAKKAETKAGEAKPGDAKAADAKKAEVKAGEAKPAEMKAPEAEPGEAAEEDKPEADMEVKTIDAPRAQPVSQGRGMVFLVKRGTWEVLWSGYRQPSLGRSRDLDEAAGRLANALKHAMESNASSEQNDK